MGNPKKWVPRSCWRMKCEKKAKKAKNHVKMVSRSVIRANDLFHQLSVPIKFYIYVKNYGESEKRVPRSCWLRKREKKKQKWQKSFENAF